MKTIIIALMVLFCSCATWQVQVKKSLVSLNESTTGIYNLATPLIDKQCSNAIQQCALVDDKLCAPLAKCQMLRENFTESIVAIKYLVIDANNACDLANKIDSFDKLQYAVKLFIDLKQQACFLFMPKKGDSRWKTFCR